MRALPHEWPTGWRSVAAGLTFSLAVAAPGAHAQTDLPDFVRAYLKILESDDTGPNATASGTAIITTCATGANGRSEELANQLFQQDCNILVGNAANDTDGVTGGLNALAADQLSAQHSVPVRRNEANVAVIAQRMQVMRIAADDRTDDEWEQIAGTRLVDSAYGTGLNAGDEYGRLGFFGTLRYQDGDEDENAVQDGFDFSGYGLTAGFDYRFSDSFVAGVALTYADAETDYDQNRGELDTEMWGGMVFGTWFTEGGMFFEGMLGYTSVEYDMSRTVNYGVGPAVGDRLKARQTMSSSPDGDMLSASIGAGLTFNRDSWSITPGIRLDYVETEVDGYTETSTNLLDTGGSMILAVGDAEFESMTSNVGVQIANVISGDNGVWIPQASIAWVHEFEDDGSTINARYANDINRTEFDILTTDLEQDYFDLSVGISAQFADGRAGFLSYRTLLGYDGLTYNLIEAGFRLEF